MRPYLLFILACACALAGALGARAQEPPPDPTPTTTTSQQDPDLVERELQKIIGRYRRKVWHWQRVMGHRLTRTAAESAARPRRPRSRLAARRDADVVARAASPARGSVALHPTLRGRVVEGLGGAVLRRPADGSRFPANLRPLPAAEEGHGRALDSARADVGGGACAPCGTRVLSLAEHGAVLRPALGLDAWRSCPTARAS